MSSNTVLFSNSEAPGADGPTAQHPQNTPWWTCPPWCLGDCAGGELEHLGDGHSAFAGRLHERTLADVVSPDDGRAMRVRVVAERCDNPGDAHTPGQVVLHVEREPMPTHLGADQVAQLTDGLSDEACRRQLALFLTGAYDSLTITLPPRHRRAVAAALLAIDALDQPGLRPRAVTAA